MANSARIDIASIVKRGWLIVVVAVIAGATVAVVATSGGETTYQGKTYLSVTPLAVSSFAQIPKVDTIISRTMTTEFREKVARELGIEASDVAAGLKVFSTGNPQDQLWVQFTSENGSLAKKGATVAARQTLILAQQLGDTIIGSMREQVSVDEKSLAALPTVKPDDSAALYYRWGIEKALANDKSQLAFVESAYGFDAETTVAESPKRLAMLKAAFGGALAGLFLGVVVAALREWLSRRAADAE